MCNNAVGSSSWGHCFQFPSFNCPASHEHISNSPNIADKHHLGDIERLIVEPAPHLRADECSKPREEAAGSR